MAVDLEKLLGSLSAQEIKDALNILATREEKAREELRNEAVKVIRTKFEDYVDQGIDFSPTDFSFIFRVKSGKATKAKTTKTSKPSDPDAPPMTIRKFKGKVYPVVRGKPIDPVFAGMSKEELDNLKEPNPDYKKYMDDKNKVGK